jgi:hypothetical protein
MVSCFLISIFNPLRLLYFPLQEYDPSILNRYGYHDEGVNRPGIFSKRIPNMKFLIRSAELNTRMLWLVVAISVFDIPRLIAGFFVIITGWRLPYMLKLGEATD